MRTWLKEFIKTNKELINSGEFEELYELAYENLADMDIRDLSKTLSKGLNIDAYQYAGKVAIKKFALELNNYKVDTIGTLFLPSFVRLYMQNICGLDFEEFSQLVVDYLDSNPQHKVTAVIDGNGSIYLERTK